MLGNIKLISDSKLFDNEFITPDKDKDSKEYGKIVGEQGITENQLDSIKNHVGNFINKNKWNLNLLSLGNSKEKEKMEPCVVQNLSLE